MNSRKKIVAYCRSINNIMSKVLFYRTVYSNNIMFIVLFYRTVYSKQIQFYVMITVRTYKGFGVKAILWTLSILDKWQDHDAIRVSLSIVFCF